MWVCAWSAVLAAQVKNSQSGIPFAIGVKDGRGRAVRRQNGGIVRLISPILLRPDQFDLSHLLRVGGIKLE